MKKINNEYKKQQCRLDSRLRGNDRKREPEHDTPSHCHCALDAESIKQQCRMDSRLRGNDRGEKMSPSDTPSLSPSDTLSLSPSGLTGGSIGQECRLAQSGRSMVEILGTLAIIGVLSIGGIAGYSYGMDKYRANQTVNDIMLRAVDLIAQATHGQETLTLAEWQNESTVYDISGEDYTHDNLIVFDVGTTNPMPQSVCKMLYDTFHTQAFQIDINDKVANTSAACVQENTMTFYFDYGSFSPDGCKNDSDCGEGRYCDTDTGICFRGDKPEGSYGVCTTTNECCPEGSSAESKHGNDCTLSDGTAGVCYYGDCLPKGCTYTENKCEGFGIYCASPNAGCTEAFPNDATGTCVEVDFTELDVGDKTYYVSYNTMYWWDADAACKALGREMIGVSDLINGWSDGNDSNSYELTPLGQALQNLLGEYTFVWTNNLIDNSCNAWSVNTAGISIGSYRRHIDYGFAMCR